MSQLTNIILKPRKALPFYRRHPWVLDSAIERVDGPVADGCEVNVLSHKEKFVARGLFNSRSRIRVRLYSWNEDQRLDEAFFQARIERAFSLRRQLSVAPPDGAERLVFSEADGLSGLVVDRYCNYAVVQVTALAIAVRLEMILKIVDALLRPKGIVLRTEPAASEAEGIKLSEGPCLGTAPEAPIVIQEHGIKYKVDLLAGQKTGFYLDQRDNRLAAAKYLSGRRVLDMFCYTGGFSLAASILGHAKEVLGFDSSDKAVATARENAALNGVSNVRFEQGEAFDTMQTLLQQGERFGAVILDPPKFAGSKRSLPRALRAYHWLNRLAVRLLEPGGILVTCSCSGRVSREQFREMLLGVAEKAGREIQVLEQRGAAPDHPVHVGCPETEYLKCFICRVL